MTEAFAKEADLCAAFIAEATKKREWKAYPESCGFDILMVRVADGIQIGIEAKLSLNAKVLTQIIPRYNSYEHGARGPHYRAVLVPEGKVQAGFSQIAKFLGIDVIKWRGKPEFKNMHFSPFTPDLPDSRCAWQGEWFDWCPDDGCDVPEFMPDVAAGVPSPVKLSEWKIKAIKMAVISSLRPVKRSDFKALGLSPTIWLNRSGGWMVQTLEGYIPGERMPDFRKQHPSAFAQIEQALEKWAKDAGISIAKQAATHVVQEVLL